MSLVRRLDRPSAVRRAGTVGVMVQTEAGTKVTSATDKPLLWNLMWPIVCGPEGSFYFDRCRSRPS